MLGRRDVLLALGEVTSIFALGRVIQEQEIYSLKYVSGARRLSVLYVSHSHKFAIPLFKVHRAEVKRSNVLR